MKRLKLLILIWWAARVVDYQTFHAMIWRNLNLRAPSWELTQYLHLVEEAAGYALALDELDILLDHNVHMFGELESFLTEAGTTIGQPWQLPVEPVHAVGQDGPDRVFSSSRLRAWTDEFAVGVTRITDSGGPITSP